MKILLAHNFYSQPGGEDTSFQAEREILAAAGHHVFQYTYRNAEISCDGLFATAKLGFRTIWSRDTVAKLRTILRQESPDVAHFHNTFPLISPAAYYACREVGIPVVQTLHNFRLLCPAGTLFREGRVCKECVDHSLWRGVASACYRGSQPATAAVALMLTVHRRLKTWERMVDRFIAPSDFVRREFLRAGLPPERISVKPHFVPHDPGVRSSTGEYALFVGRLAPEKGLHTLVQAARFFEHSMRLRIVGDGPLRAELTALANRERISNVCFDGWLTQDSLRNTLKRAAFLIFPSEWAEPFGLAIIEAFACGVPVIVSNLGAPAEIVEHGKTGLHFTAGDSHDLAAKVLWAQAHPGEMETMGMAARAEYEVRFTGERNRALLLRVYGDVMRVRKTQGERFRPPAFQREEIAYD